ncbi:hypothetical protein RRF57_012152 [Xylaria bambusicola]|uniref:Uncharacterized protein n=1 Tax=Xylaria bambusicola TaxID=326684 RepID=A0AAN7Z4A7_9PEZI
MARPLRRRSSNRTARDAIGHSKFFFFIFFIVFIAKNSYCKRHYGPGAETPPATPFALHDALADAYPAYTRVVHASRGNVCSLAYAVSQGGARKLIRRFNEDGLVAQWDLMLRDYCSGGDTEQHKGVEEGKKYRESLVCLTVQPPLICHRYEAGGGASVSDIRGQGGGFAREKMGSPYIRLSVQGNLDRLLAGYPEERLVDQLPDYGNTLW